MLPMGLLFILATAAPQTNIKPQTAQVNTCYTIQTYHFRRQDGLAPVQAGVTTCTPANLMQQRQVSDDKNNLYVPLTMNDNAQSAAPKTKQK